MNYNLGMTLKVNSVISNEYVDGMSIQDLLNYSNIEAVPWLVISVNGVFIDRAMFKHHTLHDGDAVEMIYVRGGG